MLALGIVLTVIGLAGTVYGWILRGAYWYGAASLMGETWYIDLMYYVGIVVLIVGVVMIFVQIAKRRKAKKQKLIAQISGR